MVNVIKVNNDGLLKQFIDLPHKIYACDPNYVPELYISVKGLLNKKKHPFHRHSEVEYFLAYKNNELVGRIAAIKNNKHISFHNSNDCFFGFFDSINDEEVANELFKAVADWAKREGLTKLMGPTNFSTNETCGALIEGFDSAPTIMMPYNGAYYDNLITQCGFSKKSDLLAYLLESDSISERSLILLDRMQERLKQKGIIVRMIDHKNFYKEVAVIKEVYNSAWSKNTGFVPMTDDEFEYLAEDLKLIYDPEFCYVAEHNGRMIGFALGLPDINQILKKIKNGRLFPFGLFKLLYYKRKINMIRVLTLGVIEPYRKLGIEACFYANIILNGRKKGIHRAEASWILENNLLMNQALLNLNSKPYKKYRIYEKAL